MWRIGHFLGEDLFDVVDDIPAGDGQIRRKATEHAINEMRGEIDSKLTPP